MILANDQPEPGGQLLSRATPLGEEGPLTWRDRVLAELETAPNVRLLSRTTVFGWYDGNLFGALERVADHLPVPPEHLPRLIYWRIQAKRALLCAGAEERPLVFGGNDRPGVMLASAGQTLVNRYGVAPGRKVAVFTNGDSGYQVARDLQAAGVPLACVIDARAEGPADHGLDCRVRQQTVVADTKGGRSLKAIEIVDRGQGRRIPLECDTLLMSGGWNPILHLTCHRGTKPVWGRRDRCVLAGRRRDRLARRGCGGRSHDHRGLLPVRLGRGDGDLRGPGAQGAGGRAAGLP